MNAASPRGAQNARTRLDARARSHGARDARPRRTLPRAVAEWAESYGDRPALIGDEESYSFTRLAARINQYARWGLAQDIAQGRRRSR